jgi:broad specificity phosphatase PhoE
MEAEAAEAKRQFVPKFTPVYACKADPAGGKPFDMSEDADGSTHKLVCFVRHGQGFHNLIGEVAKDFGAVFSDSGEYDLAVAERCPYIHPGIQDPPLTHIGREDAKSLRGKMRDLPPTELVVCSPLRRATQTVLIGLSAVISAKEVHLPVIALENLREQHGVYLSDKRSDRDDLINEFGHSVIYDEIESNEDTQWTETLREPMVDVAYRAEAFFEWLKRRPEKIIFLGSHSAWLFAAFNVVLQLQIPEEGDFSSDLRKGFSTGELRPILLTYSPSS